LKTEARTAGGDMTLSATDTAELEQVRRRVFLALFVALAVVLNTLEFLLPNPIPWFRLGLANILGLTALYCYGVRELWLVSISRIFLGSLLFGRLFGPGFLLSLGGGVLACTMMSCGRLLCGRWLGPVGTSVLGALGHVSGQLLIAWLVVIRHPGIWMLLPFFLLFALISGIFNGLAAYFLLNSLAKHPAFKELEEKLARIFYHRKKSPHFESETEGL